MNKKFKNATLKAFESLCNILPILIGIILLMGLAENLITKSAYSVLFTKNTFLDSVIGSSLGSILAGNPVTSYILGGELLKQGVGLVAVTSFLVAWVTVGLIQLPAESIMLGKKFAVLRNMVSFIFSIIVAIITTFLIKLL